MFVGKFLCGKYRISAFNGMECITFVFSANQNFSIANDDGTSYCGKMNTIDFISLGEHIVIQNECNSIYLYLLRK